VTVTFAPLDNFFKIWHIFLMFNSAVKKQKNSSLALRASFTNFNSYPPPPPDSSRLKNSVNSSGSGRFCDGAVRQLYKNRVSRFYNAFVECGHKLSYPHWVGNKGKGVFL
jgi:hypothetical protein